MQSDGLTVADLCNRFLTAKLRKRESGELGLRMFGDYREVTDLIVAAFGNTRLVDDLASDDFESLRATLAERWGPVRLGNAITRIKSVFKYAFDNGLIDRPAAGYGGEFRKPDKAVLRRHRAQNGTKMLEAQELARLIAALEGKRVVTGRIEKQTGEPETITLAPNHPLKAMVLLGLNAGFGNHDVATLPLSALDLEGGWVDFRPEDGHQPALSLMARNHECPPCCSCRAPAARDKADADLVFLQKSGRPWLYFTPNSRTDMVSWEFFELLKACACYRKSLGFYAIRHVFRTVADAARDPVAIDLIMGHTDPTMGGHYRERIDDNRLRAVTEYVRSWLFGNEPDGGNGSNDDAPDDPPTEEGDVSPARDEGDTRPVLRLFAG